MGCIAYEEGYSGFVEVNIAIIEWFCVYLTYRVFVHVKAAACLNLNCIIILLFLSNISNVWLSGPYLLHSDRSVTDKCVLSVCYVGQMCPFLESCVLFTVTYGCA